MQGDTLYPLNSLKDIYPGIYDSEVAKYKGREHVPKQHISLFGGCLWNDVLFFVAADPAAIYEERRKAGWVAMKPQKYFKIDPRKLDQSKLGIFLFQDWADPTNYVKDNFTEYRYEELSRYTAIPQATKDYFRHEFEAGAPYVKLLYRYVPHILYHGSINISQVEIVNIK